MSSTRDGTIYIGSAGRQQVFRVQPGADTAEVFIAPGTGGLTGVVGAFADDASKSVSGKNSMISSDARGKLMKLTITGDSTHVEEVASGIDGVTSLAIVGNMVYALEAQLALYNPRPGGPPLPPEKPFRLVGFELKK